MDECRHGKVAQFVSQIAQRIERVDVVTLVKDCVVHLFDDFWQLFPQEDFNFVSSTDRLDEIAMFLLEQPYVGAVGQKEMEFVKGAVA